MKNLQFETIIKDEASRAPSAIDISDLAAAATKSNHEVLVRAQQLAQEGLPFTGLYIFSQLIRGNRADNDCVALHHYHFSIETLLKIASRPEADMPSMLDPLAELVGGIMDQNFNTVTYKSFSFISMMLHPNGFDDQPYQIARRCIRRSFEITDAISRAHLPGNKNLAVCYLTFQSVIDLSCLNGIISSNIKEFNLKDFYTIFSRPENAEIFNEDTAQLLIQSLAGCMFMVQAMRASNAPPKLKQLMNDGVFSIKLAQQLMAETLANDPQDNVSSLSKYYLFYNLPLMGNGEYVALSGLTTGDHVSWYKSKSTALIGRRYFRKSTFNRKKRVAICVSGQMRGFANTRKTWSRFEDFFEPVYFVHTWNKIGRRMPELGHAERVFSGNFLKAYEHALAAYGFDAVRNTMFNLFDYIDNQSVVDRSLLSELYQSEYIVVEDENDEKFNNWSNYDKMYYKISACNDLAFNSTSEFDGVMRIRADKSLDNIENKFSDQLESCFVDSKILTDTAFFLHHGVGFCIGDQVMLGSAKTMALLGDPWGEIKALEPKDIFCLTNSFQPHANLANTVRSKNVIVEEASVRWGSLLDPDRLSGDAILYWVEKDHQDKNLPLTRALLDAAMEDSVASAPTTRS
ncbi:hypothetical protein [Methylobacterium sp. OT2]|uniref:hypothetical protein n=1 Tax=Methylobacterium sp. OT2 TaxID=2813779 RepID=UPI00197C2CFC|nr:hypothetical protein [Methylobacterium sp. OT2]MBN4094693.1 hypothetical protein [Methylobacterium sp. OT2]